MKLGFINGFGSGMRFGAMQGEGGVSIPQDLVITPGSVYQDFETIGDWTGASAAANTSEFKQGTQSIKLTSADGATATMIRTINKLFSVTERRFRFWLYLHDDLSKLSDSFVYVGSAANLSKHFVFPLSNYGLVAGWNQIIIPASAWTAVGGESWDNTMIRMQFRVKALAGQTLSMSFDDLVIGEVAKPAVLFTFDDGLASVYSAAYAYMKTKRIRGTSYVITNNVDGAGSLTAAQVTEMYAGGWAMANHGAAHLHYTTGGLTQEQIEADIETAQAALEGWGAINSALHVAPPWGEYDATVQAAYDAVGVLTGRNTTEGVFMLSGVDIHQIPIRNINQSDSLAATKAYIDNAISKQNVVCLVFHDIIESPTAGDWSISDFQALIDYIRAVNMQSLTISELYALESGDITVNHK